ncbi:MAG: bifunctional (p)ppGpp synthetase/guanosine-3',5'-bis(diphosphate) 3'-pyrophosphohydrolase [Gammaproteobacteria bacterium]|nr:bifunctional (p)ppGpp synthetase/guanosine-3',5'-bis(diphosphate) 3'-pyrophosphohydrolase [Gammaproteobacteria bacterium]
MSTDTEHGHSHSAHTAAAHAESGDGLPELLQQWLQSYRQSLDARAAGGGQATAASSSRTSSARQEGSEAGQSLAGMQAALQQLLQARLHKPAALLERLQLLDGLAADPDTITSALVSLLPEQQQAAAALHAQLNQAVSFQLQQLQQLRHYRQAVEADTASQAEGLRRLLLALVRDVRVVLIALVDQLMQMRHVRAADSDEARRLAAETRLVHAPLANRLGVWQLKWELEDLAFHYLEPEHYRRISRLLDERRVQRERFIQQFMRQLQQHLDDNGIAAEVSGRPKHIYSIWRKMQRKNLSFDQLYDVRAVRVLVNEVKDCYSVLGLAHMHWLPVPGEFDDYIRLPKANNYQSLHTAVSDDKGRVVEVQIRTRAMHEHAELGVAAHWRYKEGSPSDQGFEQKLQIMRQLLEAGDEALDDQSLLDSFHNLTSDDRVYVLTPKGEVMDMAGGSTVLDFAYQVHTSIGHRCRGAKVNGRIVPLTHQLSIGEQVEIMTAKQPNPSRDWLSERYLHNPRSRNKLRQWFREVDFEQNAQAGKDALEAELQRTGLNAAELPGICQQFNCKTVEALHAAIGAGDCTAVQVSSALARHTGLAVEKQPRLVRRRPPPSRKKQGAVTIEGIGNLMYQLAKCCQPLPGDNIVGYITKTRGVSIHRHDCPSLLRLQQQSSARIMQVNWGGEQQQEYLVDVELQAYDRKGLIKDISTVIAGEDISVAEMHTSELDIDMRRFRLKLRIREFTQLSEALNKLQSVPNIVLARRVGE